MVARRERGGDGGKRRERGEVFAVPDKLTASWFDSPSKADDAIELDTTGMTIHDVVAFVDDAQQVRHVPVTRADEVPKAWRRARCP